MTKVSDSESFIDYLCVHMEGNKEYDIWKGKSNTICITQKPYEVRDFRRKVLVLEVEEYG